MVDTGESKKNMFECRKGGGEVLLNLITNRT